MSLSRREFISAGLGTAAALTFDPFNTVLNWPDTAAAAAENTSLVTGIALGDSLFDLTGEQIDKRLSLVKGLGADAFRVDFDGSIIEPSQAGDYNWTVHDKITTSAEKYGLEVLATVTFTNPSDRAPGDANDYTARPRDVNEFAEMAGAIAARYGKTLKKYEIWNEPNASPNPPGSDPSEYAQLANASGSKIKRAQSDAMVAIGALASVQTVKSAGTMLGADFLAASYTAGLKGFDAVSFHAYSMPRLPNFAAAFNYFMEIEGGPGVYVNDNLLSVMAKHGDAHLPIWITELGATTGGTGQDSTWTNVPNNWDSTPNSYVSEQIQALTVKEGLTTPLPKANVTDRYVYTLMDRVDPTPKKPDADNHYGLLLADYKEKPAAAAFKAAAKQRSGARS